MSSKLHVDIAPQQLTELEVSLERDDQALQECTRRRAELEQIVKTLRREIGEEERGLTKLERDVQVGSFMRLYEFVRLFEDYHRCWRNRQKLLKRESEISRRKMQATRWTPPTWRNWRGMSSGTRKVT